jgi:large subunit ribosomal protein L28
VVSVVSPPTAGSEHARITGLGLRAPPLYDLLVARPSGRARTAGDFTTDTTVRTTTVAANCDVCGKGPGFGHSISHSHRRTKRRWNPNIQTVRAMVGKTPKKLNVCTSCIKAGKVARV